MLRPSVRQLRVLLPVLALLLILAFAHRTVPQDDVAWTIQYGQQKLGLHPCSGWEPDSAEEHDPPDCLRARQWREVESLMVRDGVLRSVSPEVYPHNLQAIARLKMCILNEIKCPPRPVILSGWWYMTESVWENGGTTGEVIWMKSLIQQFEQSGYILLGTRTYEAMVELSRLVPSVIHQVWASEVNTVSCVTDPRCITPEHYRPPWNSTALLDPMDPTPATELGAIPLWRLHAADYWGARPSTAMNTDYWWGRPHADPTEWSFNPLGSEWTVVPFKYPGHAFLPFSIEKLCAKVPWVPHPERQDVALIYAKKSSYFFSNERHTPAAFWKPMAANLSVNFISTASIDPPGKLPLPGGIKGIGSQGRLEYEKLVSEVKVLVGIGRPTISPSVYSALCQGTPVVLPYFKDNPTPDGWALFSDWTSQHGPALSLGEPYVYGYRVDDMADMQAKIQKASETPIGRHIPPEMKWDAAVTAVRRYLAQDWQAKFDRVLFENEGAIPRMVTGARERCFELGRCKAVMPEPREGRVYRPLEGVWIDA